MGADREDVQIADRFLPTPHAARDFNVCERFCRQDGAKLMDELKRGRSGDAQWRSFVLAFLQECDALENFLL